MPVGAVTFDLVTSDKPAVIPPNKSGEFPHPILRAQSIYIDWENVDPVTGEIPQKVTSTFEMVRFNQDGTFSSSGETRSDTITNFLSSSMVEKYESIPSVAKSLATIVFAEAKSKGII